MFKKTLEALIAFLQLTSTQPNLPSPEQYFVQHQKPAIYAQHSYGNENLTSIMQMAEASAATRPHLAIALYRRVMAEGSPLAEKAIEGAIGTYRKKLPFKEYNKWEVENALSFFDEVIEKHPKYAAEAYLKSGEILCDLWSFGITKTIPEAMDRLEQAYLRGDKLIKAKARFKQGWTENLIAGLVDHFWNHEIYPVLLNSYSNIKRAERRLLETMRLAPESEEAKMARNLLEVHGVIETK